MKNNPETITIGNLLAALRGFHPATPVYVIDHNDMKTLIDTMILRKVNQSGEEDFEVLLNSSVHWEQEIDAD